MRKLTLSHPYLDRHLLIFYQTDRCFQIKSSPLLQPAIFNIKLSLPVSHHLPKHIYASTESIASLRISSPAIRSSSEMIRGGMILMTALSRPALSGCNYIWISVHVLLKILSYDLTLTPCLCLNVVVKHELKSCLGSNHRKLDTSECA